MGLDSVELVISFEEAFGIELRDEEVTETRTPRMVIDLIFSKLKTAEWSICRSQRAFYVIRKVLLHTLALDRRAINPDARLRELIPESRERQTWEEMRRTLAARDWPRLARPRWMSWLLLVLSLGVLGMTIFTAVHRAQHGRPDPANWVNCVLSALVGGAILAGLFALICERLTRPFCLHIPTAFQSIRDLIPYAITSDHIAGWTRDEVAAVVKRLTMEQLGLDESEYAEDSRFVEDFWMD